MISVLALQPILRGSEQRVTRGTTVPNPVDMRDRGRREVNNVWKNIAENVAEKGEMIIDSHANLEATVIPNRYQHTRQDVYT